MLFTSPGQPGSQRANLFTSSLLKRCQLNFRSQKLFFRLPFGSSFFVVLQQLRQITSSPGTCLAAAPVLPLLVTCWLCHLVDVVEQVQVYLSRAEQQRGHVWPPMANIVSRLLYCDLDERKFACQHPTPPSCFRPLLMP